MWVDEKVPSDLRDAAIVKIYKKGDQSDCGNYRGIALLATAGKVLVPVMSNRLSPLAETIPSGRKPAFDLLTYLGGSSTGQTDLAADFRHLSMHI